MQILVCTNDSTVRDQVVEEITALGHEAQDWILGDVTPLSAHLIVIDGIDTIANVDSLPVHVPGLMDSTELSSIPADVDDIVLKPLRDGELRTRLHRLCERPSRQRELHYRLLAGTIERTSDVIELTNAEATLEYVNPAYEQALGLKTSEVIGKTPAELVRSEMHPPEYFAEMGRKLFFNRSWSGTLTSCAKSGHLVHFDTTISPMTDHHREVTHHVAVKRDITDRLARDRALEETNKVLEQARDAALASSKAKSEFLANMRHEPHPAECRDWLQRNRQYANPYSNLPSTRRPDAVIKRGPSKNRPIIADAGLFRMTNRTTKNTPKTTTRWDQISQVSRNRGVLSTPLHGSSAPTLRMIPSVPNS